MFILQLRVGVMKLSWCRPILTDSLLNPVTLGQLYGLNLACVWANALQITPC